MSRSDDSDRRGPVDMKHAIIGGAVAALVALIGTATTGVASGAEAQALLETVLPSIRFLASAVITASATIMALMLTILSLSHSTELDFQDSHYSRVEQIGSWCTAAIVGGTILLLFLSIPTEESELLSGWYEPIYYVVVVLASMLGGIQVAVVLMLRQAILGMVAAVRPGGTSHLVNEEQDREGQGHEDEGQEDQGQEGGTPEESRSRGG